jgi:hypothetical protein
MESTSAKLAAARVFSVEDHEMLSGEFKGDLKMFTEDMPPS